MTRLLCHWIVSSLGGGEFLTNPRLLFITTLWKYLVLQRKYSTREPSDLSGSDCACGLARAYLPTGSITEHDKALLIGPFYEGHTGVLLPVSHGLLKNGPLAS